MSEDDRPGIALHRFSSVLAVASKAAEVYRAARPARGMATAGSRTLAYWR